ncbi:MAG: hypothetical protein NTY31_00795 [Candidatus Falkowbacteria bacterium]|nr:hypothetical protein [Candidatus Falkowbacteria bacterium]
MVTLSLVTIVILATLTLGTMAIIGLFNKKINGQFNLIIRTIRALEVSRRNLRRLPSRIRLLIKIWPQKRGLLFLKITKRLRIKRQKRKKRRRDRRRHRKDKRQKNRSNQ